VQEDRSDPLPCTDADKKAYPRGQAVRGPEEASGIGLGTGGEDAGADTAPTTANENEDDLLQKMLGAGKGAAADAAP